MAIGTMFGDIVRSFFRRPATRLYPVERVEAPARMRGQLRYDPEKCVGCGLCSKDCPADALELITLDKKAKRFVIRFDVGRCTFCGQCVSSCRFDCLEMPAQHWELADFTTDNFVRLYGEDADVEEVRNGVVET